MNIPKQRYLQGDIATDLAQKMVFLGGPRQVGKTTLAQMIGKEHFSNAVYLNWDDSEHKRQILQRRFNANAQLVIFDELHKYKVWKNYIKGIFDTNRNHLHILVTGSARLDLYRRGGDSLMGRYHYYRLHPFSVAELIGHQSVQIMPFQPLEFSEQAAAHQRFVDLFNFSGFPEPLLQHNERTLRRWQHERLDRLVREDIREVELVRDVSAITTLSQLLPGKVGSLFSLNALREDLFVTHKTVALWVDILERFYYHFRIYPFTADASKVKSLRREPKLYLWDWSEVEEQSSRLENIVASHLLKFVHYLQDTQGYKAELWFLRDRSGREVDFLVTVKQQPWFAVEVKTTDTKPAKHLHYFADKMHIPYLYQVVDQRGVDVMQDDIRIMSVENFLSGLI